MVWVVALWGIWPALGQADYQGATLLTPFDEDTIGYSKAEPSNAVSRLQARVNGGQARLGYEAGSGYLKDLLRELGVSTSSQMLVFSKTSFQRERIGPSHPRGLFFNEEVYVGYVPGSPMLELAAADPQLGAVFYTLDQVKGGPVRFKRNDQCLECHYSAKTLGVPGHLVRSFETDESGVVDLGTGTSLVNHRTPLADRWGGWYVTGTHGAQVHRGNLVGGEAFRRQAREPNHLGNRANLKGLVSTEGFPRGTSDIVSLMVFEHQAHLQNLLTKVNYETRLHSATYGHVKYLRNVYHALVKYLLFTEEAPLTAPVRGEPEYVAWFEAQGPKDSKGRSLRQFDLRTRMFRYPCSYGIYSAAYRALPEAARVEVERRLVAALSGEDAHADFKHLDRGLCREVWEILAETIPGFPSPTPGTTVETDAPERATGLDRVPGSARVVQPAG